MKHSRRITFKAVTSEHHGDSHHVPLARAHVDGVWVCRSPHPAGTSLGDLGNGDGDGDGSIS